MENYFINITDSEMRKQFLSFAADRGLSVVKIDNEEYEDFLLGKIMSNQIKREYVDKNNFLKELENRLQD